VTTAQARHTEKQQHAVEAFTVVDRGSSILIDLQSADDYHAETSIIASAFIAYGLPRCLVLDRDPRFVGGWSSEEFPSAFMRFVLNLGVALDICPPQRPDLKPFVERYFRTLKSECIRVKLPATVEQTRAVFAEHRHFYNHSRPNQSKACGNRPPYAAFPTLPVLPHMPTHVDPDTWLLSYHNHLFRRRVMRSGRIQIDNVPYYISHRLEMIMGSISSRSDASSLKVKWSVWTAVTWTFVFSAISIYWALSGTWGIDTLGDAFSDPTVIHDPAFIAFVWLTTGLKLLLGLLPLALLQPRGARVSLRLRLRAVWFAGIVLTLYGIALMVKHSLIVVGANEIPVSILPMDTVR